jgi:hypothetical protein
MTEDEKTEEQATSESPSIDRLENGSSAPAEENKPEPVEFKAEPIKGAPQPTSMQKTWLRDHKSFVRMSHHRAMKFTSRGTLKQDGSFITEAPGRPVHDGNGDFGVGIPTAPARRR